MQVVDVLKASGLDVTGMVSIFTYDFPVAADVFQKAGITYYPIDQLPNTY